METKHAHITQMYDAGNLSIQSVLFSKYVSNGEHNGYFALAVLYMNG